MQSQTETTSGKQNDGVIAQLVEQRTENPCVPGSIPGDTTEKALQKCRAFFVYRHMQLQTSIFKLPHLLLNLQNTYSGNYAIYFQFIKDKILQICRNYYC